MQRTIIALAAILAVADMAAAGPVVPACFGCFCGSASTDLRYCRLLEEGNDYPAASAACSSTCNGTYEFLFISEGNFCPSPPCPIQNRAPAMSQPALSLTAVALLSLGVLYLRRRIARR
jgi:hypothetical protein